MLRSPVPLVALAATCWAAAPAAATDRSFPVGSFDRLRVDGPFEVRVIAGTSPRAIASADRALLDRLDIRVNGSTLVVRLGTGEWSDGPRGSGDGTPPVITLTAPRLTAVTITAGARVTVARMAAPKVDLSLAGAGALTVEKAEADQLNASLLGPGAITLGGRADHIRLLTNGPGTVDAAALVANDAVIRIEGLGETRATARYTAQVTTTGLGKVTVRGGAKCEVNAMAGGPVSCGR